jgi:acyl-CoA synthetase (AMP-forming)/AMP-acid ligase II
VLERALAAFADTGFCNAYGLTETSSTVAILGPDEHRAALESEDPAVRARLHSIGRPVPGVRVEIRDPDGAVLPAGAEGQLFLAGPQISGEYATGSALDGGGWFDTKDNARVDDQGYIFVSGRADDTIIRGGENIAPAEIEDVLSHHPAVLDSAVIGRPSEEWGQEIVAFIVADPAAEISSAEIREYVRSRLRGSRTPDDVVWVADLPRTPTGKLIRRELTDLLVAGATSSP